MNALFATVRKELLLLRRDRSGLMLLFLMPVLLVIIICLVQENVMKATGEAAIRVLLVNRDAGEAGRTIERHITESDTMAVTTDLDASDETARTRVNEGQFQFCLIIPEGFSERLETRAVEQVKASLEPMPDTAPPAAIPLIIYFDPVIQGTFRTAVTGSLQQAMLRLEMAMKAGIIAEMLPAEINRKLQAQFGLPEDNKPIPAMSARWGKDLLLTLDTRQTAPDASEKLPSSIQHNVPAWSLFGMFFTVVPLGGALIRERQNGTIIRLRTLPVSYLVLLSGKVIAYLVICLLQFTAILMIGKWLLPVLGTPELEMGASPAAVVPVILAASLAAAGYGVAVGTAARTYEQASMFGAVSIVIAAALGGIMIPVYVMPKTMQVISQFSPLAWGLDALTDIFVRDAGLADVLPDILRLLVFFLAMMGAGLFVFIQRCRKGLS